MLNVYLASEVRGSPLDAFSRKYFMPTLSFTMQYILVTLAFATTCLQLIP